MTIFAIMSVYIAVNVKKNVHRDRNGYISAETPGPGVTVEYAFDDYWEKQRQNDFFNLFEERKLREEERFQVRQFNTQYSYEIF